MTVVLTNEDRECFNDLLESYIQEFNEIDRFRDADPAVNCARAFTHLADNSRTLHLFQRYEIQFDRESSRALNNLLKLQAKKTETQPVPMAATLRTSKLRNEANFRPPLVQRSLDNPEAHRLTSTPLAGNIENARNSFGSLGD
jgi:hypothetical protein